MACVTPYEVFLRDRRLLKGPKTTNLLDTNTAVSPREADRGLGVLQSEDNGRRD